MVANVNALHNWGHEDYDEAKRDIHAQLGRIDLEIFGRQVLVAVYTRPVYNHRNTLTFTQDEQRKDWWEGKVVLVIAHGPEAFTGTPDYIEATYPDSNAPKVGDWLFQNANTGMQFSFKGDGAERVMYSDKLGRERERYPSDGWPVRIVTDDGFLGRLTSPHSVV